MFGLDWHIDPYVYYVVHSVRPVQGCSQDFLKGGGDLPAMLNFYWSILVFVSLEVQSLPV